MHLGTCAISSIPINKSSYKLHICTRLGFDIVVLLFLWKLNKNSKSILETAIII